MILGVSDRRQARVLKDFREGHHKILIATSVAEEGLDIPKCNLILRYNYSTNEIGRMQTKGMIIWYAAGSDLL